MPVFPNGASFNAQRIQGVGTPTASTDGVNKAYVDPVAFTLTYAGTVTADTTATAIKAGGLVTIHGYWNVGANALAVGGVLFTAPAGYRPPTGSPAPAIGAVINASAAFVGFAAFECYQDGGVYLKNTTVTIGASFKIGLTAHYLQGN